MANEPLPPSVALGSDFSDDRLRLIASTIAQGRAKKLSERRPQDVSWNLNCDCYIWAWWYLREASKCEYKDWLYIPGNHGDLSLCFYVGGKGGTPAKFYRADAPGQPERTSRPGIMELGAMVGQGELALDDRRSEEHKIAESPAGPVVRFAVKVAPDLSATSVNLQTIDADGNVVYDWPILLDDIDVLPFADSVKEEPIQLAEIELEMADDKAAREEFERLEKECAEQERLEGERKINEKKGA